MPLVVAGVCRFALNQTFHGRDVVNIVDMDIDSVGELSDRNDAITDQAEVLAKQWSDDVMPDLVSDLVLVSVSWVDLNSEDGSTGSFSGSGGTALPHAGGVDNNPSSSNVSILVTKQTSSGRGSKNGRMYVCGLPEAYTTRADPNHIDSGFLATLQEDFDAWLTNINQDSGVDPPLYNSDLNVVHNAAGGTPSHTKVDDLNVQGLLATQRRRLRG